ncbi:hypothetical protein B0T22DRAFT_534963 [Podospora appendiculata]|uniref:Uncharacterized protein n=1 Tax=Podospora appendiculata TaxID=314037 RepID=A0AAE0X7N1_9PEZI|nr:hypothetical protein B0T22DRAFT_534963 [Podospora appendiculata]
MADFIDSIDISNGTCYSEANTELDQSFIPCGNVAFGHIHCCSTGDKCLGDNACWNGQGATYLAGCTDIDYQDASCPNKVQYGDDAWVGLIKCNTDEWYPCHQKGNPTTIASPGPCLCKTQTALNYPPAFTGPSINLDDVAWMPHSSGGSLSWFPGHGPTHSSSDAISSTSGSPSSSEASSGSSSDTSSSPSSSSATGRPVITPFTTLATSSITSSATSGTTSSTSPAITTTSVAPVPAPNTSSELGTGAKIGIGLGSAFGGMLIFGALSAFWLLYRRNRKNKTPDPVSPTIHNLGEPKLPPVVDVPQPTTPATPVVSELGSDHTARPWSLRSELYGTTVTSPRSATFPPTVAEEEHHGPDAGDYGQSPLHRGQSLSQYGQTPPHRGQSPLYSESGPQYGYPPHIQDPGYQAYGPHRPENGPQYQAYVPSAQHDQEQQPDGLGPRGGWHNTSFSELEG